MAVKNQCRAVCALCRINARTVYAMGQIVGELQLALSLDHPGLHGAAVKCVRSCFGDTGQQICPACVCPGFSFGVCASETVGRRKVVGVVDVVEESQQSWWSTSRGRRKSKVKHANERDKHPTSDNTRFNHAIHAATALIMHITKC